MLPRKLWRFVPGVARSQCYFKRTNIQQVTSFLLLPGIRAPSTCSDSILLLDYILIGVGFTHPYNVRSDNKSPFCYKICSTDHQVRCRSTHVQHTQNTSISNSGIYLFIFKRVRIVIKWYVSFGKEERTLSKVARKQNKVGVFLQWEIYLPQSLQNYLCTISSGTSKVSACKDFSASSIKCGYGGTVPVSAGSGLAGGRSLC